LLGGRLLDPAFDLVVVPIEIGEANAIADQSEVPKRRGAAERRRIVA